MVVIQNPNSFLKTERVVVVHHQINVLVKEIYEDDIKKYLKYTISNYGKNFIELYENF
jgi:hypothetical protein